MFVQQWQADVLIACVICRQADVAVVLQPTMRTARRVITLSHCGLQEAKRMECPFLLLFHGNA